MSPMTLAIVVLLGAALLKYSYRIKTQVSKPKAEKSKTTNFLTRTAELEHELEYEHWDPEVAAACYICPEIKYAETMKQLYRSTYEIDYNFSLQEELMNNSSRPPRKMASGGTRPGLRYQGWSSELPMIVPGDTQVTEISAWGQEKPIMVIKTPEFDRSRF
jgi:hypothetical protein